MRAKKKIMMLAICMSLVMIAIFPGNAYAGSIMNQGQMEVDTIIKTQSLAKDTYIKKTASAVDGFVREVLSQTQIRVNRKYSESNISKKNFMSQLKKVYNGKLSGRQKSMIAANQTAGYSWASPEQILPTDVGTVSVKKVKKKYKELFGTKNPKIDLPVVSSKTKVKKYYLDYAKNKSSKVYALSYEDERDLDSKIISVEKTGRNRYTITKRYKFYSHWGIKMSGGKPTQTVIVKIKVKKKSSSPYKYNITGISFQ